MDVLKSAAVAFGITAAVLQFGWNAYLHFEPEIIRVKNERAQAADLEHFRQVIRERIKNADPSSISNSPVKK
jgi:hypothetical protein